MSKRKSHRGSLRSASRIFVLRVAPAIAGRGGFFPDEQLSCVIRKIQGRVRRRAEKFPARQATRAMKFFHPVRSPFVRQIAWLNRWTSTVQYAPGMESGTKNRVRLWLRSERAFGLNAVPLPRKTQLDRIGGIATPRHPVQPDERAARRADERTFDRQAQNVPPANLYREVAAPTETSPRGGLIAPPASEPFAAPLL